jgi:ketosteroid isomerase-like protein
MSEQVMELAARMLSAFRERDLEALVDLSHPEVEVTALVSEIEGTYKGHDGVRRWMGNLLSVAPEHWVEVDSIQPVGGDGFIALGRQGGSAKVGGTPFELELAVVGRFRDGLLYRSQAFRTHAEAREAAGLSE